MVKWILMWAVVAACGGRGGDDAHHAVPAPVRPGRGSGSGSGSGSGGRGEVAVRVDWPNTPIAVRQARGRNPCGLAAHPQVEPTTMWGVPDVVIVIDGDAAAPAPPPEPRVVYRSCALSPRITLAARSVVIGSERDEPVGLNLYALGPSSKLGVVESGAAASGKRAIELPIAGHAVVAELAANTVYELDRSTTDLDRSTTSDDSAFIVTAANAAVTDASGGALLRGVAAGVHEVSAWQPYAHQLAHGTVTVVAGQTAELTLELGK